jgi:hypothetical protein
MSKFTPLLMGALLLLSLLLSPPLALAEKKPGLPPGAVTPMPAGGAARGIVLAGLPADLPRYVEPASYRVDLVVTAEGREMTMKRFIDGDRIRTEMSGGGQDVVMLEMGDEAGTSYMLMPGEKRAMKQSRAAMAELAPQAMPGKMEKAPGETPPADLKVEDLGDETRDGKALRKLRFVMSEGAALGWFDKSSGAPVRMEATNDGKTSVMEWKNFVAGPQPAKLYEVPKGYDVTDMDEMMQQMKSMRGKMPGMMGKSGMPGMGSMAGGVMGGMGQSFGESMGGSLGSSFGAALGGPLGAVAGQYIGGKIGGMVGKKAAGMVTPGK